MEKKNVKGNDVFIFDDEAEFRRFHSDANVKEWRDDSVKEGDWVRTDLGGVTKCLKATMLEGNKCITTICGTYRTNIISTKMDNTIRSRYTSFTSSGKEKSLTERPLTKKDKIFARLTMLGENEIEAYKKVNPDAKSERYIKQKISTVTNKIGYDSYMSDEFTKLLTDSEMTKKWGLDILKKIAEDDKAPAGVRKEIADDILADHGERQQRTTKEIHSWHASSQISSGELTAVKKIGEKVEKEIPNEAPE